MYLTQLHLNTGNTHAQPATKDKANLNVWPDMKRSPDTSSLNGNFIQLCPIRQLDLLRT